MARSVWKGPYFDVTLFKKVKKSKEESSKSQLKHGQEDQLLYLILSE